MREQEVKIQEEAVVVEEAKPRKEESVSSESESEEEAEYHPYFPVSISHTQIPEEKEEEEEQEKQEEDKTPELQVLASDASSLPAEVIQPAEETRREEVESRKEDDTETQKTTNAGEEKEVERETEESTDDPMVTPDEAPNGLSLPEEGVTVMDARAVEEEEPKMNGEPSLTEAEPLPQVICCSEVKSSLGRLRSFPGL